MPGFEVGLEDAAHSLETQMRHPKHFGRAPPDIWRSYAYEYAIAQFYDKRSMF